MSARSTGRTTNMLRYAIQRWRNRMPTVIVGKDIRHVDTLGTQLQSLFNERDRAELLTRDPVDNIAFVRLDDLVLKSHSRGPVKHGAYGYSDNRFYTSRPQDEVLFDHFALEYHLAKVVAYLDAIRPVIDANLWLITTARVLSVSGQVAIVVPLDQFEYFAEKLQSHNVKVVADDVPTGINWTDLSFNHLQTLFHPVALHAHFKGALEQITRFE